MEARLKADVLSEAALFDNHILVTEEDDDMQARTRGRRAPQPTVETGARGAARAAEGEGRPPARLETPACPAAVSRHPPQVVERWEPVTEADVQTPLEVYRELRADGYAVEYVRLPVTDEKARAHGRAHAHARARGRACFFLCCARARACACRDVRGPPPHPPPPAAVRRPQAPKDSDFEVLVKRLWNVPEDTALIFNCQMGRGRTTTGMIIGTLMLLRRAGAFPPPAPRASGDGGAGAAPPAAPAWFAAAADAPPPGPGDARLRGGLFGVVRSLLRVLESGNLGKAVLDAAIDAASAMQNLREAISQYRGRLLAEAKERRRAAMMAVCLEYLERCARPQGEGGGRGSGAASLPRIGGGGDRRAQPKLGARLHQTLTPRHVPRRAPPPGTTCSSASRPTFAGPSSTPTARRTS